MHLQVICLPDRSQFGSEGLFCTVQECFTDTGSGSKRELCDVRGSDSGGDEEFHCTVCDKKAA